MNSISPKQVRVIHTLKNKVFCDDEEYRHSLSNSFGVQSSKNLSTADATKFINALIACMKEKRNFRNFKASGKRGLQQHLTQLQADRITILIKLLKWEEPNRLTGFIQRQTGKLKAVEMLANYEATRVIVGLEKILSNNNNETFLSINKMSNAELEKCL